MKTQLELKLEAIKMIDNEIALLKQRVLEINWDKVDLPDYQIHGIEEILDDFHSVYEEQSE